MLLIISFFFPSPRTLISNPLWTWVEWNWSRSLFLHLHQLSYYIQFLPCFTSLKNLLWTDFHWCIFIFIFNTITEMVLFFAVWFRTQFQVYNPFSDYLGNNPCNFYHFVVLAYNSSHFLVAWLIVEISPLGCCLSSYVT